MSRYPPRKGSSTNKLVPSHIGDNSILNCTWRKMEADAVQQWCNMNNLNTSIFLSTVKATFPRILPYGNLCLPPAWCLIVSHIKLTLCKSCAHFTMHYCCCLKNDLSFIVHLIKILSIFY